MAPMIGKYVKIKARKSGMCSRLSNRMDGTWYEPGEAIDKSSTTASPAMTLPREHVTAS